MPNRPLFLARAVYRRRRLRDAARLLPILGLLLLMLPALGQESGDHRRYAVYLFATWAGLIAAASLLAPGLRVSEGDPDADSATDPVNDLATPESKDRT